MRKLSAALVAAAMLLTVQRALADQQYSMSGQDVYRIGTDETVATRVVYTGTQRLSVLRQGSTLLYDAQAKYVRDGRDGKSSTTARFVQELLPSGAFSDKLNEDPDFLTILNQPFAVQLDPATLKDLKRLRHPVPFEAASPLGNDAVLRGFLQPGTAGDILGRPAIAVRFQAEGPMSGPLPTGVTSADISGTMHMDGNAYYALDNAMLLALDATLTIVATLRDNDKSTPVKIVYRRFIRASGAPSPELLKTLRPTPLPTDDATASPASP